MANKWKIEKVERGQQKSKKIIVINKQKKDKRSGQGMKAQTKYPSKLRDTWSSLP
jgi:hypothetical protein